MGRLDRSLYNSKEFQKADRLERIRMHLVAGPKGNYPRFNPNLIRLRASSGTDLTNQTYLFQSQSDPITRSKASLSLVPGVGFQSQSDPITRRNRRSSGGRT